MKLETTETVTLYISLPATEFDLVLESGYQTIPWTGGDVVLRTTPYPELAGFPPTDSQPSPSVHDRPASMLRVQVRADYFSKLHPDAAGGDLVELRIQPGQIPPLNRNLVGPIVPLGHLSTAISDSAVSAASIHPIHVPVLVAP